MNIVNISVDLDPFAWGNICRALRVLDMDEYADDIEHQVMHTLYPEEHDHE